MKELFATICLLASLQALFLSVLLFLKRKNRRANRFLSLVMVFATLDMLELYLGAKSLFIRGIPYYLSIIPYPYIFGPSIFLYVSMMTARIKKPTKKLLIFYLPFLLMLIVSVSVLYLYGIPDNNAIRKLPEIIPYLTLFVHGSGLLFESFLYVLSLIFLQKYAKQLNNFFSDADRFKLTAFKYFLLAILIIDIALIIPFGDPGHVRHNYELLDIIAILVGLILIFAIAFLAVIQPEIFSRVRLMTEAIPDSKRLSPKYEKLRLPIEEEQSYAKSIEEYMTAEKPYLDEELTLQDLADMLSIPTHLLSMILNIHFRQNFYNFVNSYRVEEIKNNLSDPKNYNTNILAIAYSAGFNSKSTFNTMFKKFTGMTPKEYRSKSLSQNHSVR